MGKDLTKDFIIEVYNFGSGMMLCYVEDLAMIDYALVFTFSYN